MRNVWLIGTALLMASMLGACSSSGTLSCTSSGTVSSGSAATSGQTVTLATTVSISGGSTPYSVTLPGQAAVSTSSTSYSGTATETTTGANTFATDVTVSDSSTSVQCAIGVTSTTSGTGLVNISATPGTNVSTNQMVTLTATAPNVGTATWSFASSTTSGITINPTVTSGTTGTATVSNTGGEQTVTITVTAAGSTTVTNTIELCFGTTGCPASSSTTGAFEVLTLTNTGYSATLLAYDQTYPTATFSFQPTTTGTGLSISQVGTASSEATVTTTQPGIFQITVFEFNAGSYIQSTTTTVTLLGGYYYGGGGTTTGGSITCTLNVPGGTYYAGQEIQFPITTSDGELAVIQNVTVTGPEGFTPPGFPIYTNLVPFNLTFSDPLGLQEETETVNIWATDTSGNQCNNNPLQAVLYINE